jgi:Ca2+-binding EF-hand superfamily protein
MKAIVAGVIGAMALTQQAAAQDLSTGRSLAAQTFFDSDADGDARLTAEELEAHSGLVFVSMDADEGGTLSEQEFLSWGFGMSNLADEGGTRQSHDTALRMVFDLWDRDNDAAVTEAEQSEGVATSFAYADLDADGALTEEEFLQGFIVNLGMRNALSATSQ